MKSRLSHSGAIVEDAHAGRGERQKYIVKVGNAKYYFATRKFAYMTARNLKSGGHTPTIKRLRA